MSEGISERFNRGVGNFVNDAKLPITELVEAGLCSENVVPGSPGFRVQGIRWQRISRRTREDPNNAVQYLPTEDRLSYQFNSKTVLRVGYGAIAISECTQLPAQPVRLQPADQYARSADGKKGDAPEPLCCGVGLLRCRSTTTQSDDRSLSGETQRDAVRCSTRESARVNGFRTAGHRLDSSRLPAGLAAKMAHRRTARVRHGYGPGCSYNGPTAGYGCPADERIAATVLGYRQRSSASGGHRPQYQCSEPIPDR